MTTLAGTTDQESKQPPSADTNPPNKKAKVDDEWIRVGRVSLKMSERGVVSENAELNDLVINCAQTIMYSQFPHLNNGFQSTLLLPKLRPFDSWMPNYIQVFHVRSRRHWITVTTKDCSCGEVIVYDTLYDDVDCSTKTVLEHLFSCSKEGLSYKMADGIQKQQGVTDCGVFAIAFAVSLAYGNHHYSNKINFGLIRMHGSTTFYNFSKSSLIIISMNILIL